MSFFLPVSLLNFSISVFSLLLSLLRFLCHHGHYHQQRRGGRKGKERKKGERCGGRVSNIGSVHSSLPQITAINQPGQKLSHQLDLKHWVPLDKPTDLHIYRREGGSGRQRGREAWAGKQKGTSAAKLSLNIISPSLVHYLFNKLLRAERAVHGLEVTHYAFYDKAACGFWQGAGHYAKDKWRKE